VSDPDVNELEALSALLASDGWALFLAAVEQTHGDTACMQQIDNALKAVDRGDHEAVQDTVQQIRARAKAVQAMVRVPGERVKQLKAKKEKPGMFQGLRRA
jgi:LDH2 family malate/lactate/ureidoglycolate dehydrogenase